MVDFSRIRCLGLLLVCAKPGEAVQTLVDAAEAGKGGWVAFCNAHMTVLRRRDKALRQALASARWIMPDGAPLVWTARHCGDAAARQIAGPATTARVCATAAERGLPIALYGGTDALLDRLVAVLGRRWPRLVIACRIAPPFRPQTAEEEAEDRRRIVASGARICFVSLGCPKQECWCDRNAPQMPALCLAVGAALPMLAGVIPRAPAVFRHHGLEWLYRLAQEPRRLWRRYLGTNPAFINLALREIWRR